MTTWGLLFTRYAKNRPKRPSTGRWHRRWSIWLNIRLWLQNKWQLDYISPTHPTCAAISKSEPVWQFQHIVRFPTSRNKTMLNMLFRQARAKHEKCKHHLVGRTHVKVLCNYLGEFLSWNLFILFHGNRKTEWRKSVSKIKKPFSPWKNTIEIWKALFSRDKTIFEIWTAIFFMKKPCLKIEKWFFLVTKPFFKIRWAFHISKLTERSKERMVQVLKNLSWRNGS